MAWFVTSLRENAELAIFLTLAIGFVIGGIRIGSFHAGDVIVVGARRQVLLAPNSPFGEEVEDRALLDFPMAALDVVVTRKAVADPSPSSPKHTATFP